MIPRKNGIEAEGIPSVSVETSESTIPRKPIFLEGGPTPEPVIESLNVTENGTYTAPEGVDGYNPVTVNVPAITPTLTSLSVTENGTYTPQAGVDGFNSVSVNVSGSVYTPTYIKIIKQFEEPKIGAIAAPEKIIYTDWCYLISAGEVIVPELPDDDSVYKLVSCNIEDATVDSVKTATIFYCFTSNTQAPRCRGSYPNDITYTTSANQQVMPDNIYKYEPGVDSDWIVVTKDQSTWQTYTTYYNRVRYLIYSNVDVIRNTAQDVQYQSLKSLITYGGKLSGIYNTDYFDLYYCVEGTKINPTLNVVAEAATVDFIGNMTLKGMYDLLSGGSFPPNE